jgi:hypothetical protein
MLWNDFSVRNYNSYDDNWMRSGVHKMSPFFIGLAGPRWASAGRIPSIPQPSNFVNRKFAQKLKKIFSQNAQTQFVCPNNTLCVAYNLCVLERTKCM